MAASPVHAVLPGGAGTSFSLPPAGDWGAAGTALEPGSVGRALGMLLGPLEVGCGCTQGGWRTGPSASALAPSGCKVSLGVFVPGCWRCSVLAPLAWGRSLPWGRTARARARARGFMGRGSGSSSVLRRGGAAAPCPPAAPGLRALLLGVAVLSLAGCCLPLPAWLLLPASALWPPVLPWRSVLGPWPAWPSSSVFSLPGVLSIVGFLCWELCAVLGVLVGAGRLAPHLVPVGAGAGGGLWRGLRGGLGRALLRAGRS